MKNQYSIFQKSLGGVEDLARTNSAQQKNGFHWLYFPFCHFASFEEPHYCIIHFNPDFVQFVISNKNLSFVTFKQDYFSFYTWMFILLTTQLRFFCYLISGIGNVSCAILSNLWKNHLIDFYNHLNCNLLMKKNLTFFQVKCRNGVSQKARGNGFGV